VRPSDPQRVGLLTKQRRDREDWPKLEPHRELDEAVDVHRDLGLDVRIHVE